MERQWALVGPRIEEQVARSAQGANLGELGRIEGIRVPPGFCVTAGAYRRIVAGAPSLDGVLDRLVGLRPDDREAIGTVSAEIRRAIEEIPLPDDLVAAVGAALARLGEHAGYAVRSSATAEDLPTASFAGQQDSYLNVVGVAAILEHIRVWARCSPMSGDLPPAQRLRPPKVHMPSSCRRW